MVDVNSEILQSLSQRNFGLDLPGGIRAASGVALDPNGVCRQLYSKEFNLCYEELVTLLGGRTANFPGTNGSYWQAADNAAFEIAGDIDIRIQVDTYGGPSGSNRAMVSRWAASPNQVWEWRVSVGGATQWFWSTLGTDTSPIITTAPFGTGARRIFFDVDDGGGNKVLTHYLGFTLDAMFQNEQDIVAGTTSIFTGSTSPLRIGARADASGSSAFIGRISRMQLRNSAGTLVADFDVRFTAPGTTTFVDSVGITWTAAGSASIV